jgi:hypothetical protein
MTRAKGLSKSRLIAWRQCPKRLWLEVYRPDLRADDPAAQHRFDVGNQVGEIARDLEEGGVLVGFQDDPTAALAATRELMEQRLRGPLFEPAFQHDGLLVRVDLLLPGATGHHLVEVKSTASVKEYHLADAAIQAWVGLKAGFDVERVSVAHLDTDFEYPGDRDYRGLLYKEDVTDRIRPLVEEVPGWLAAAREVLDGETPEVEPGGQCHDPFECPFQSLCLPEPPEYPLSLLPGKNGKALARRLADEGYTDLREVPANAIVDPLFRRIHTATVSGEPFLDPKAKEILARTAWPHFYLDFETAGFAVPVWAGTRAFQAVPFQWSCHVETAPGKLEHAEFLDTTGEHPARRFAETLIDTLGRTGTIFVYSGYERRILSELARRHLDLADTLAKIIGRLFDLLPLTKAYYYHPEMKGSWSIKDVLPAIAPDLDYGQLGEVQDGTSAQDAFAEILNPGTQKGRKAALTVDLLGYCRLDTLAMYRLACFLEGKSANQALK